MSQVTFDSPSNASPEDDSEWVQQDLAVPLENSLSFSDYRKGASSYLTGPKAASGNAHWKTPQGVQQVQQFQNTSCEEKSNHRTPPLNHDNAPKTTWEA